MADLTHITKEGRMVKILQTNVNTYLVQGDDGRPFNVLKGELGLITDPRQPPTEAEERSMVREHTIELAVDGRPVYEYTDAELYAIICDMEETQARLSCIKNKPTSLVKLIDSMSNDIIKLLEWMDNRP